MSRSASTVYIVHSDANGVELHMPLFSPDAHSEARKLSKLAAYRDHTVYISLGLFISENGIVTLTTSKQIGAYRNGSSVGEWSATTPKENP